MKKFCIILFALIFGHEALRAQDWVQTGGPTGNHINAIGINQEGDIFVISDILTRSTDQGKSWKQITTLDISRNNASYGIAITPNGDIYIASDYIYGGNLAGLWKSTDNGDSWVTLFSSRRMGPIVSSPDSIIYVVGTAQNRTWILSSKDAGKTWDSSFSLIGESYILIAVDSNNVVSAFTSTSIYISKDKGKTWSLVKDIDVPYFTSVACGKMGNIFVSSLRAKESLYSTDDGLTWASLPFGECKFAASRSGRILSYWDSVIRYSDDNGKTWKDFGNPDQFGQLSNVSFDFYSDIDSGFYSTFNGELLHAKSPGTHNWKSESVPIATVSSITNCSNGALLASSLYGNSMIWRSIDTGNTWIQYDDTNHIDYGMAPEYLTEDSNKNIIFFSNPLSNILRKFFSSSDNGLTWIKNDYPPQINQYGISSLVTSPSGVIYLTSFPYLLFSHDSGLNWDWLNLPFLKLNTISSLVISSTREIFVGAESLYKSNDFGTTWRLCLNQKANRISITSQDNIIVATDILGLIRTTDNGNTWSLINEGLRSKVIRSLLPTPSQTVFVSTDSGVFKLDSGANAWLPYSEGLTTKKILSLTINSEGRIFAGSDGAGVFKSVEIFNSPHNLTGWIFAENLGFDTVAVGETVCKELFIANYGSVPFTLSKVFTVVDPAPFSVDPKSASMLPIMLKPNDSIRLTVCFHPSQPAVYVSEIVWNSNIDASLVPYMKSQTFLGGIAIQKNSVKNPPTKINFSIRPNPVSGNFITITFPEASGKNMTLAIYDVLGKEIYTAKIPEGVKEYEAPVGNLSDGIYYARATSGTVVLSEKFVKTSEP